MNVSKKTVRIILFYSMVISLFLLGTIIGNQAVMTVAEMLPVKRQHFIIIDAGHGGEDGGAISCTNKKESTFNLQISLRLEDLFHLLGYDTMMIRKTDSSVYTSGKTIAQKKISDLKHRVEIVNSIQNGILISIHQNTFPEAKYSGAQVFFAKTPSSAELANQIQAAMIKHVNPGSTRKEKEGSGIFLLEKIQNPGILVECGFLSNAREEELLSTPDYQKKLCCIIAASTAGFLAST